MAMRRMFNGAISHVCSKGLSVAGAVIKLDSTDPRQDMKSYNCSFDDK